MNRVHAFSRRLTRRFSVLQKARTCISSRAFTISSDNQDVKPFSELPSPGKIENIIAFIRKGGMKNLYQIQREKFEKLGPIFKEDFLGKTAIHVADADAFATIVHDESQVKFPIRDFVDIDVIKGTAIYAIAGNDYKLWKEMRAPVAPSFLRPKEIQKVFPQINSVASDAIKRLQRELKEGRITSIIKELQGYTSESILSLVYGERMGFYNIPQEQDTLDFIQASCDYSQDLLAISIGLPIWRYVQTPAYKRFVKANETLYHLAERFAQMRHAKQGEISAQYCLYDEIPDSYKSSNYVNEIAIALSQNGVETSSTTLEWCLYNLSTNPEVQEKAYKEVISVIGTADNDRSSEIINFQTKLPYVKACLDECMRVNPISIVNARSIQKDTVLCGYKIPAHLNVCLWNSCLSFNTKYFSEPETYKPERWLRGSRENIHPFAVLPFGFGVRMCLGRRFAEMEMLIFLARVLQTFRLDYVGDGPVNMLFSKSGVVRPDREPLIQFIERQ